MLFAFKKSPGRSQIIAILVTRSGPTRPNWSELNPVTTTIQTKRNKLIFVISDYLIIFGETLGIL
jgi:hypothetical protein